jgi:hypothetical protein
MEQWNLSKETFIWKTREGDIDTNGRVPNELLNLYESEKQSKESSPDDILLYDNVHNFIPNNEIGLGCTLLNANVASTDEDQQKPWRDLYFNNFLFIYDVSEIDCTK